MRVEPRPGDALPRAVVSFGFALLGLQLVGALVFSAFQYGRYSLTNDFGGYAQAWYLIGHGHLNPYVSMFGTTFVHNNLDLAMYPLALIGRVFPHPVMLSWSQDVAVVATEAVALVWIRDLLRARSAELGRTAAGLFLVASLLFAFHPWSWETMAFPLHFEAVATFFAVLAARDLWRGRYVWLWAWVPLAMTSEALGSLYVLAVGVGALLRRGTPRTGRLRAGLVAAAGAAGLALVTGLGLVGRGGATLTDTYGYLLDHGARPGPGSLILGLMSHPGAAASTFAGHLGYVAGYLIAGGLIGVVTSTGAAAVVLVIVPNALSSQTAFIGFVGAFQSWFAEPFLIVGSVTVAASVIIRAGAPTSRIPAPPLRFAAASILTVAAVMSFLEMSSVERRWSLPPQAASELAAADRVLPKGAEVVARQNIIGRLAMQREAYSFYKLGQRLPVTRPNVAVVLGLTTPLSARVSFNCRASPPRVALYRGRQVKVVLVRVPPGCTKVWLS